MTDADPLTAYADGWTADRFAVWLTARQDAPTETVARVAAHDLGLRWARAERTTAADYLVLAPQLNGPDGPPLELVRAEFQARLHADLLDVPLFAAAYPAHRQQIESWDATPPTPNDRLTRATRLLTLPAADTAPAATATEVSPTPPVARRPTLGWRTPAVGLAAFLLGVGLASLFALWPRAEPSRAADPPSTVPATAPPPVTRPKPADAKPARNPPVGYDALLNLEDLPLLSDEVADKVGRPQPTGGAVPVAPGERVLLDVDGPGVVTRVWATGSPGQFLTDDCRLKWYLDGAEMPAIDLPARHFFGGEGANYPFLPPLAGVLPGDPDRPGVGAVGVGYVPVPFAKRLRVVGQRIDGYHIAYRRLKDTPADTWTPGWAESQRAKHDRIAAVWDNPGRRPWPDHPDDRTTADKGEVPAGEARVIELTGPGVIDEVRVTLARPRAEHLRQLVLSVRYDEADGPSVSVPLADLCGGGDGTVRLNTLLAHLDADAAAVYWPMPFRRGATLTFTNEGPEAVEFHSTVRWRPVAEEALDGRGYFHARYAVRRVGPRAGDTAVFAATGGRGKLVGVSAGFQSLAGDRRLTFLDRASRLTADNDPVGSVWQSDVTSFFGGANRWDGGGRQAAGPLGGLAHRDTARGLVEACRWLVPDAVPFRRSARWTFDDPGADGPVRGGGVVMYYLDTATGQPPPPPREVRRGTRPEVGTAVNVFGCELEPQAVVHPAAADRNRLPARVDAEPLSSAHPDLPAARGLVYRATLRAGEAMEATMRVLADDEYTLILLVNRGPGFGKVRVQVDDKPAGGEVDLSAQVYSPWQPVSLGKWTLARGRHRVRFVADADATVELSGVTAASGSPVVPAWHACGTWDCRSAAEWDQKLPPETNPDPVAAYDRPGEQPAKWVEVNRPHVTFTGGWKVGYGLAYVHAREDTLTCGFLSQDDSAKVWVGDELVHDLWAHSDPSKEQGLFAVRLKKGWNRLLVKCGNWDGDFGFQLRLADPGQKLKYALKPD